MTETCTTEELPDTAAPVEKRKYLLTSGIAKCGECGEDLEAKPNRDKTPGLACVKASKWQPNRKGCGRVYMSAHPLEEHVAGKVLAVCAMPGSVRLLRALMARSVQTGSALTDEIAAVNATMRQYGKERFEGTMSPEAFKAADAAALSKVRELRAQVRRAQLNLDGAPMDAPKRLAHWWEHEASMQEKHDLVRVVIEEIRILPTVRRGFRGFQPERVQIVWQPGIIWNE